MLLCEETGRPDEAREWKRKAVLLRNPTAAARPGGRKVGRNEPCPCGSGRKYKKCCDPPGKLILHARRNRLVLVPSASRDHRRGACNLRTSTSRRTQPHCANRIGSTRSTWTTASLTPVLAAVEGVRLTAP